MFYVEVTSTRNVVENNELVDKETVVKYGPFVNREMVESCLSNLAFRTDIVDINVIEKEEKENEKKVRKYCFSLSKLQKEVGDWSHKNFPDKKVHQPLLGLIEEVGELSHAHLKLEQNIRTNENHSDNKFDAVGDIVIYLADYCEQNNIDLEFAVAQTWSDVQKRDWTKNKEDGTDV